MHTGRNLWYTVEAENLSGVILLQPQTSTVKKALLCAFPHTVPIFAGFWFLGLTYGIYMNVPGFSSGRSAG